MDIYITRAPCALLTVLDGLLNPPMMRSVALIKLLFNLVVFYEKKHGQVGIKMLVYMLCTRMAENEAVLRKYGQKSADHPIPEHPLEECGPK